MPTGLTASCSPTRRSDSSRRARARLRRRRQGPPLLMLHGNPTWSFLYRDVIAGLRERFRCIAPDLPGFGFSTPAAGFGFRPSEHSQVIERFIGALDLRDITLMVHD